MFENIAPILLGSLISLLILFFVIKIAVREGNNVKYRDHLLEKQLEILVKIAKKQGVEFEENTDLNP